MKNRSQPESPTLSHCIHYEKTQWNSWCWYLRFDPVSLIGELFLASVFGGLYLSHREVHNVRGDWNLPLHITGARKVSEITRSGSAPWHQLPTEKAHRAGKFWLPILWDTHALMNLNTSLSRWQQRLSRTGNLYPGTLACLQVNTDAFTVHVLQKTHLLLLIAGTISLQLSVKSRLNFPPLVYRGR